MNTVEQVQPVQKGGTDNRGGQRGGERVSLMPGAAALTKAQWWLALCLSGIVFGLHVVRLLKAGGLWRDEAAVVGLATMPTPADVCHYFTHEAFPLLFPFTIRGIALGIGQSDVVFRCFGLVVGLATIAALWVNLRGIRRSVPLVSLAFLGFNGAFVQWGDSVRGYGLGTLCIMLFAFLVWRLVEQPGWRRFIPAVIGAVAAVQTLFHNAPLVLAVCLGGCAVSVRRRQYGAAGLVLLAGGVAALSLAPYWGPLHHARDWDVVVRAPAEGKALWTGLHETLSASGWSNTGIWAVVFLVGLASCWQGIVFGRENQAADVLRFGGTALVVGLAGCLAFLTVLSYTARPWYFLALVGLAALLLDLVWDAAPQQWARVARPVLAAAIAVTSLPLTWHEVNSRQTNMDLIAAKLTQSARPGDLIIVSPWFMGISFDRYYRGSASWITMPPIEFHKFHRYDLVQKQMQSSAPGRVIAPVEEGIAETLKAGHRVWIAGLLSFQEEHPHKEPAELASALKWSHELAMYLRASARHLEVVKIDAQSPVNHFENSPLRMVEGWAGAP
jgi:hypothetical protein